MLRRFLQRRPIYLVLILAITVLAALIGGAVYAASQAPTPDTIEGPPFLISSAHLDNTSTYKTMSPTRITKSGDSVSFTIRVHNDDSEPATGGKVSDPLPAGVIYKPGTLFINNINQNAGALPNPIDLPTIGVFGSATVLLQMTIGPDVPAGKLTNEVTISADGVDEFTRSVSTTVVKDVHLDNTSTRKTVSASQVITRGLQISYIVYVLQ